VAGQAVKRDFGKPNSKERWKRYLGKAFGERLLMGGFAWWE